ncbi:hypothetical protein AQD72_06080 [Klebsiella pneumoniae]|uniref:fimbrial protein n=1 Tax=Klebsiella pneumoniae TaxID=573 RepID=UPI00071EB3E9|nr:fimbrial protein [Klebsiella pneumoniae]ALQ84035.1 hypothetical protein AQD68_08375 [Klebsiella pneumoniae]ALQ89530.1 hypothetical protein AQD73_08330 [Klebsiella pneumoniae]OJE54337.1 hypothetical protein AQD70_09680 [Klebsiella pneumoniae]OJE59518.1 hypothetical protein AQD71_27880 [Klebsiella pneumoniae]OJE63482.1 hypothetical protein AQD69_19985 [Klebsiella pneumoniae]
MGLFNATLVMVSYLFISFFGVVLAKENSFILGRVNMQGAIIDTACTISFGNQKQTIDMGMLSLSDLVHHGTSRSWFFSIKLTNCMSGYNKADSLKKFNVTFDGERDGKSFGIKGDATGVALQIIDTHGHVIEPGKSMPLIDSSPEYNQLDYAIRLITDRQTLKSGIFWSHIKFRLDYF